MASLTGQLVAETYKALLKLIDNDILTASEKQITDGFGGGSNVFIDSQGFLRANKYKVTNGLATQFLKADGSLDSNAYLTSITGAQVITALGYTPVPTTRTITINGETHNLAADNSWTVGGTAAIWGNITGTLSNQTDLQNALNAKYNNPTGTISQYIRGDGTLATFPTMPGGLPTGGSAGQILAKIDATDYNTHWIDNYATQTKNEVKLGQTLTKGTPVYVLSANGTNIIVSRASNTSEALSSKTFGLLESGGATNDIVKCVTFGLIAGLDTSTAQAGDPVWLGVNGALIFGLANKPYAPAHLVYIGVVTRVQQNNGEIFVNIQNGFELKEIHDVYIADPANNHGLFYDIADGLWKNKSIISALGYTPQAQLSGTGFVKASGTTITYDNSTYLTTTDAVSTYQRLDKMVSNLLPSATEYPNSNAVIAALALKADAANPVFTGNMTISGAEPKLYFTDTDQNPDYFIGVDAGFFRVYDQTAGATRFVINSDGNINTGVGKSITAGSFIKESGTASQFLKADGTIDSNSYALSSALGNYLPLAGGTMTGVITTPNGTFGIIIGDDSRLADRNIANTLFLEGNQNNDRGYINFSQTSGNALGAIDGGALTWRGVAVATTTTLNSYLPLAGGTMTGTLNINGLGYGGTLVITTNSVNGADITLNNTGTGGKNWHITSTGSGNAMGVGALQFYNETDGSMVFGLTSSRNVVIGSTIDSGQKAQIYGGSIVPLKLDSTSNFSGIEYYRNNTVFGFIGTENTTEGLRYNSIQGAFQHKFYSNSSLVATISNAGAIFSAGLTATSLQINGGTTSSFATVIQSASTFAFGSTNGRRIAVINTTSGDQPGLQFGYDATDNTGIIAGSTQVSGAGLDFYTYNGSAWASRVRLTSGGNLGIGTTSPDRRLRVASDGSNWISGVFGGNGGTDQVVVGNYGGRASIGAHNNALSAWASLSINFDGGNVLIGTLTDSGYKLHTNGTTRITSATRIGSTAYTDLTYRTLYVGGRPYGDSYSILNMNPTNDNNGFDLQVFDNGTIGSQFFAINNNRDNSVFFKIAASGSVGIGTVSPISSTGHTSLSINASSISRMDFMVSDVRKGLIYSYNTGFVMTSQGTNPLILGTNDTENLRINNGGNLLVGTTSDNGYKLQVNGNTWSNGVRIGRDFSLANRATVRIDSRPGDNPADILFGRDDAATQTSWSGVYWSISSRGSGEGNEFRIYRGSANTGGTEIVAMNINPSAGAVTFINTVTATSFFESSDIRLKTLIENNPIIDGIEKLEAKLYEKNGKIELGYFAQDAELIMPYAVTKNMDGFLNLSYREVHTAKIARLEKEVAELKAKLNLN